MCLFLKIIFYLHNKVLLCHAVQIYYPCTGIDCILVYIVYRLGDSCWSYICDSVLSRRLIFCT